MKLTRRRTLYVLAALAAVVLAYELLTLWVGDDATISRAVWGIYEEYPVMGVLAGILAGHFFWQVRNCRRCGFRPTHAGPGWGPFDDALNIYQNERYQGATHSSAKWRAGFPLTETDQQVMKGDRPWPPPGHGPRRAA